MFDVGKKCSMYSVSEKIFWVKKYLGGLSYRGVSNEFHATFPDRPRPNCSTVKRCCDRFGSTGCVEFHRKGQKYRKQESLSEIVTLTSVHVNPRRSTREMARETGLSQSTVWRKLRGNRYHAFKCSEHQQLRPGDCDRRLEFAMGVIERIDEDPDFGRKILFTDESSFTLHHGPNHQNVRQWAQTNPHDMFPSRTQYPGKVNLWAGIIDRHLIGPIAIDGTLTGEKYVSLLETEISERVAELGLGEEIWFQHDGCPAHQYAPAREHLYNCFPGQLIGRNEAPLAWPARSPDLNKLDFFLWGHITSTIYRTAPFPNVEALTLAINECCAAITPDQLEAVHTEFDDRLHYCVAAEGNLFEHLI